MRNQGAVACGLLAIVLALPPVASAQDDYTPPIPDDYKIIEGDIVVPGSWPFVPRAAIATNLWPGGVVGYEFDVDGSDAVSPANQTAMLNAMASWEAVASVQFVPIAVGPRLYIRDSSSDPAPANNSLVGRHGGAPQNVNITSWGSHYIIAHELGHALGLWHEQGRDQVTWDPRCPPGTCDRGEFVTVNYGNVSQTGCSGGSCDSQFDVQSGEYGFGPYDYDSVMHYRPDAFSTGGDTLVVNPSHDTAPIPWALPPPSGVATDCYSDVPTGGSTWQDVGPGLTSPGIGQRDHLSFWDCRVVSFMYPEVGWQFVSLLHAGSCDLNPIVCPLGATGEFFEPYATLESALGSPFFLNGTLWIADVGALAHTVPGGVLDVPVTIRAAAGPVTLVAPP